MSIMEGPFFRQTHRDLIAKVLAEPLDSRDNADGWRRIRSHLTSLFAVDDPNFDRKAFRDACEGKWK